MEVDTPEKDELPSASGPSPKAGQSSVVFPDNDGSENINPQGSLTQGVKREFVDLTTDPGANPPGGSQSVALTVLEKAGTGPLARFVALPQEPSPGTGMPIDTTPLKAPPPCIPPPYVSTMILRPVRPASE